MDNLLNGVFAAALWDSGENILSDFRPVFKTLFDEMKPDLSRSGSFFDRRRAPSRLFFRQILRLKTCSAYRSFTSLHRYLAISTVIYPSSNPDGARAEGITRERIDE